MIMSNAVKSKWKDHTKIITILFNKKKIIKLVWKIMLIKLI